MNDNLDTNQASEGELRAIIERYIDRAAVLAKQDGTSFNNKHLLKLDMATAIETIIRTEKLKLLAEVRKRVVGEKDKYNDTYEPDAKRREYKVWQNRVYVSRNELRNEQQTELAKLEAEL